MIFQCLHSRMYIAPCRSMIIDVSGLPLSRQEALYPKWYRNVLLQAMWQTCFYCVFPRTEFWEFSQFSHVSLTLGISSCWHGQVAPSMSSTSSPIYAGVNLGRKLPCPWLGYICHMWPAYGNCWKLIGDAICICEGGWGIPSVESPQLLPIGYTSAHRAFARPGSLNRGAMQSSRLALRAKPYGNMILNLKCHDWDQLRFEFTCNFLIDFAPFEGYWWVLCL